jgi:hypothetical protein
MVDIWEERVKSRASSTEPSKSKDIWEERVAQRTSKPSGVPPGLEKTARTGAQYGLGLLDRTLMPITLQAQVLGSKDAQHVEYRQRLFEEIEDLGEQKRLGNWDEQHEELLQYLVNQINNPEEAEKNVQTADVTPSGLVRKAVKGISGYDLEPEGGLEKAAEFMGSFTPKEIKTGLQKAPGLLSRMTKKTRETLPSGLTKPRAIESKLTPYAAMGKKTQEKIIEGLNKEAANLARASVHKHLPAAKHIEEAYEFDKVFNKAFGELNAAAAKHNPTINITPVSQLVSETAKNYRGIPNLHLEAQKIMKEIKAIQNKPPTSLTSLLKTYRSNNKKLDRTFELSRTKGSQKEYVDFILAQNRAIAESMRNTIGKNNGWIKAFDRLNAGFKQKMNARNTLKELDSLFRGRLTTASLEKLGNNPITQKKLSLMMGEEGAKEIGQIARDLSAAKTAIKDIPRAQYQKFESAYPLTFLIPIVGKFLGGAAVTHLGIKASRNALGHYLSKPAYRRAYGEALKAIKNQDLDAYKKYTAVLSNFMKEEHEED